MSPQGTSAPPTPRASRKLTLGFGPMAFQVGLAPVRSDRNGMGARFVCPEHRVPVKQAWRCDHDPESPHYIEGQPARGWEYGDQIVVLPDDVLLGIEDESDPVVSLTHVADELDPVRISRSYLLWPTDGGPSAGAYDLLARVLLDTGRVLLGQVKLWKKTQLVGVRWSPATATLVAHVCAFDEQMRWKDVAAVSTGIVVRDEPDATMAGLVAKFLETLQQGIPELRDEYSERLAAAVEAEATGGIFEPIEKAPPPDGKQLQDMMKALRDEVAKHGKTRKTPRKSAVRKSAEKGRS